MVVRVRPCRIQRGWEYFHVIYSSLVLSIMLYHDILMSFKLRQPESSLRGPVWRNYEKAKGVSNYRYPEIDGPRKVDTCYRRRRSNDFIRRNTIHLLPVLMIRLVL